MRAELTSQIVVRCTPEERARWKDLAARLDKIQADQLRRRGRTWRLRYERIDVSKLVRQLLETKLKATPAVEERPRRRRNVDGPAAGATR